MTEPETRPTDAQSVALENMLRTGADGIARFRPETGPTLMTYRRLVERGWAEEVEASVFRVTDAGRAVMRRKPAMTEPEKTLAERKGSRRHRRSPSASPH